MFLVAVHGVALNYGSAAVCEFQAMVSREIDHGRVRTLLESVKYFIYVQDRSYLGTCSVETEKGSAQLGPIPPQTKAHALELQDAITAAVHLRRRYKNS